MTHKRVGFLGVAVLAAAWNVSSVYTQGAPAGPVGGVQQGGHTTNPDAQWFPDAGLGLFLHWDESSVKGINIGWSVIPGRPIAARKEKFSPDEVARIVRDEDYNLDGTKWPVTPNQYWALAKDFKPAQYDPDKWLKAAKAAGFEYAVLTTKHHNGFALWPSKFGDFNTNTYMGGRDLLKEFVEACRKNNIKVGFYFSGPDWHFDREYWNFLYHGSEHPEFPSLDADLKPRTTTHTAAERAAHQKAYAEMVKGQIEELLTNYGKIDVIWFDGKPEVPNPEQLITAERIRQLQPGIVINPRLHGQADYVTYERNLPINAKAKEWAEFCNTWTNNWSYVPQPFRANGFVLSQLVQSRSLGVNYLLGVGPMATGDLEPETYANMAVVAEWMKANATSIKQAQPLPDSESASVPATAIGATRYLFALPKFKGTSAYEKDLLPAVDEKLTLRGISRAPSAVTLLADRSPLKSSYAGGVLTIEVPASKRTKLPDVVQVDLTPASSQGTRTKLFDGASLKGWNGNPGFWSVADGAIHGVTDKTQGELILTDGDYADFRLTLKSRLVSQDNHLGVCFWGDRRPDWRYGDCILVIPPNSGMWDYHQGKGSPTRANLPRPQFDPHVWHETEILANLATGTVRVAINGVEVTRYKDENPARLKKGPIGLQIHSGASVVEYKDVEVEVNPTNDRLITVK